MMKFFVLCLLVVAASAHDFQQCGSVDKLHIKDVTLSPDEPQAGKVLEVQLDGNSDVGLTGGTANLKVSVLGITIATVKFDLCKDLGLSCPVAAGAWKGTVHYTIPSVAPAGVTAEAQIDIVDGSGTELDCVKMAVKIGSGASASDLSREELEFVFEAWRRHYEVEFASAEEYVERMAIFAVNHQMISKHNSQNFTYTMAHNEFSHLSWEEFRSTKLGFNNRPEADLSRPVNDFAGLAAPAASVDWTTKGAVTPVKNQGQCGSCWAFSTTGGLEGAYAIKNQKLVSFSEQELVDCDDNGDEGCNGGLMDNAYAWIQKNGGLCTEGDYAYTGSTGTCHKSSCTNVAGSAPTKWTDVAKTEAAMEQAVAQQPVSIAIEADQLGFQFYSSGVFSGNCGTNLDHGVLNVGYGVDGSGTKYWKVKNSWGASWGMKGYILLEKGKSQSGGQCGILNSASYPTL